MLSIKRAFERHFIRNTLCVLYYTQAIALIYDEYETKNGYLSTCS